MDVLTKKQRSRCMAAVHAEHTKPEIIVRRAISQMGYRYRLHCTNLPGKPDVVFSGMRKVIFVHGCFWHRHRCKKGRSTPRSNMEFWNRKLSENVVRDRRHRRELKKLGWQILVLWECQVRHEAALMKRLEKFLDG